jgi:CDP-paratose 2-epimerase
MKKQRDVLVTGGAGFIGSNLVTRLLRNGHNVTVLDNLSRRGSEINLAWLRQPRDNGNLRFVSGDVRSFELVRALADVDVIYHLAAQVAVTGSLEAPRDDFEVNAQGSLNVLEAARLGARPVIVFASTNKVYGSLPGVRVLETQRRYVFSDLPYGISEAQRLDFHSPYGCSKGCADQYLQDYARNFSLPTVTFRLSCVYGPRQFGTEDQGWLAHFMIAAARGQPITVYGDGKQVRDILYIDDLVEAFQLAVEHIDTTCGQVYNLGGGPSNSISVWNEFGAALANLSGDSHRVTYREWRPGDQRCYVSDIRKAMSHMGWRPETGIQEGLRNLWAWASDLDDECGTLGQTGAHAAG